MVKLLVGNGANLNALNFHSQSPLILACRYEYSDIVTLLCSKGADPNLKGYFGNERLTPLSLCSRLNKLEITKILVYYGADINASDDSGPSPLFTALSHHSNEVTDLFFSQCLNKGLDVKLCRRNQETLLHALLEYKGDLKYQYVKDVIARGCPVNQATRSKNYPLHEAIGWRDEKMMKIFLDLGADWRLLDRWGQNALHVAIATGGLSMVRILLYKGADINSLTTLGVSPLYIAFEFDHIEVAEYLIDHGIDLRQELYLIKTKAKMRNMAMDSNLTPSFLQLNPSYKEYLKHLANTPPKLLTVCVRKLRSIFSENHQPLANVYSLPIPTILQSKLSFDIKPQVSSV
ncbi:hypothetical protein LOTGIDRAFT_128873 [Lottia gigantea]|uniref:Uncharacterized protein n=1 Tax=Lottia gigantea TaxID=225164 RepID=V3ZZS0_LOTGI|nr:hypothetical protein LOTGIDRAFT_128873 [Lottia gigantea]ESO86496.1 hypothetical protein LOTGIDRAFT_128873 [Lottia gigantea]